MQGYGPSSPLRVELLADAEQLAQALVDPEHHGSIALYDRCGFHALAELMYLFRDLRGARALLPASFVVFLVAALRPGLAGVSLSLMRKPFSGWTCVRRAWPCP